MPPETNPADAILATAQAEARAARQQHDDQAEVAVLARRLQAAWDGVRDFTGYHLRKELGRDPRDQEFLEQWAQRIAHLGTVLTEFGLAARLDRLAKGPKEKDLAVHLLQLGVVGQTPEIVRLLQQAEALSQPPAPSFSGHVNRWLREGVMAELLQEGRAAPPSARQRIPRREANVLVRDYLQNHPQATVQQIRHASGVSAGAVSESAAWQAHRAAQQEGDAPPRRSVKTTRLTAKQLATLGKPDDPSARMTAEESAWTYLLENASPKERGRLHGLNDAERAEYICLVLEQRADQDDGPR
jgi:hypothetical protein